MSKDSGEEILERVIYSLPYCIFWKDNDLKYLGCNDSFAKIAGLLSADDIVGLTDYNLAWTKEQAGRIRDLDNQVISTAEKSENIEEVRTLYDGKDATLLVTRLPLINGEVRGVFGTFIDITDRKNYENALKESEARYRQLVEVSPFATITQNEHGVTFANSSALKLLGKENIVGISMETFVHEDDLQKYKTSVGSLFDNKGERSDVFEIRLSSNKKFRIVQIVGISMDSPDGERVVQLMCHDITEKKRVQQKYKEAQEKWIRSERLAAVGTLASGIAHEFNNLNAVVKGHIDLILARSSGITDDLRNQLEIIQKSVNQSSTITNDLLAFSNISSDNMKRVWLTTVVSEILSILSNELSSEGIEMDISKLRPISIFGNQSKLGHVVMNLIINSMHSLIGKHDKKISIELDISEDTDMAYLRVSDNGCGISNEDMGKIFNPFFSTKGERAEPNSPLSKVTGNGLGLAVCHTIITEQHGGNISVDSEVGNGTTFVISLPRFLETNVFHKDGKEEFFSHGCNGQRILILDDNIELGNFIARILGEEGYETISTDDGKDALRQHMNQPFEMVIVDVKMPIMSGREFIEAVNKGDMVPYKLIITGRSEEDMSDLGIYKKIQKPFEFTELLSSVNKCFAYEGGIKWTR